MQGKMKLYNFAVVFLQIFVAETYSRIDQPATEIEVVEGRDVTMSCTQLRKSHPYAISWSRSDINRLLFHGKIAGYTDKRIHLLSVKDSEYTLKIDRVTLKDQGEYSCSAYQTENSEEKLIYNLIVKVPPRFVKTTQDQLRINEGEAGLLECEVKGEPTPEVSWRFIMPQVDEVRNMGEFYVIRKATRNYGGRYVCSADNGVGPIIHHEIKLTVQYPPEILDDEGSMKHGHIVSGKKTSLTCVGRGEPAPYFEWELPNKERITKDRKWNGHFTTVARNGQITRSTLHVDEVTARDAGQYTCFAKNVMGNTSRSLIVLEQTLPTTRPPPLELFTTEIESQRGTATSLQHSTFYKLFLLFSITITFL